MATFPIHYNGKEETIDVIDKPKAEMVFKVEKLAIKWTADKPEINHREYLMALATNLITRAPWGVTSPSIINSLEMDTLDELNTILSNVLPIEYFLSQGMRRLYGKRLDQLASLLATESTQPSQNTESPQDKSEKSSTGKS